MAEHIDLAVSLTRELARKQHSRLREKLAPMDLLVLAREVVSELEHLDGDPRFSVLVRILATEAEEFRSRLAEQGLIVEKPPEMEFLDSIDETIKLAI